MMAGEEPTPSAAAPPEEPQDTVYSKVRVLAVLSKFLGAFPFQHSRERDGRKLQYSWKTRIIIWDLFLCAIILFAFVKSSNNLFFSNISGIEISIWLTCYIAELRGLIQFVLLHCFASRIPILFTTLEIYHQITGSNIIKTNKSNWYTGIIIVLCNVGILIIFQTLSFIMFTQVFDQYVLLTTGPIAISLFFANLWKELPMNMFVLLCMYLTARFREISDEIRQVREKEKDAVLALDQLRLQHVALVDIVGLLQGCYGTQLAANTLFLLIDTILQLFIFFAVSARKSVFPLFTSLYYFVMCTVVLAIVEQLQKTVRPQTRAIHSSQRAPVTFP